MRSRVTALLTSVFVMLSCLSTPPLSATSITPLTWEELVLRSDFVGVVECIQAGGIVARYKVVESWLGPPKGTEMLVAIEPDPMGYSFPTLLAGQKWLMTAFKVDGYSQRPFTQERHLFPLSWRRIRPDYALPMFQGKWEIDGSPYMADDLSQTFGDDVRTLDQVRAKVTTLFFENDPELLTLRHQALRMLRDDAPRDRDKSPAAEELLLKIAEAKTVEQLLETLFKMPVSTQEERQTLTGILVYGGRKKTVAALEAMSPQDSPLGSEKHADAIDSLRSRLSDPKGVPVSQPYAAEPVPKPEELEKARQTFRDNDWGRKRWEVFDLLTRHDPALVAEALLTWGNPAVNREVAEEDHEIGSAFCFRCGKDRAALFTKLLKAKDPYVRVAAAVYLCFEDKQAGMRALRELSELPGIPGQWAAVVRIERGDKDAMPRALSILDPKLHPGQNAYLYSQVGIAMRDRTLVVLSNTARQHKLSLPETDLNENVEDEDAAAAHHFQKLTVWWKKNQDKVDLQNPWAAILEAQKVD